MSIMVRVLGLFEVMYSICAVLQGVDGRVTNEAVEHLVMVPLFVTLTSFTNIHWWNYELHNEKVPHSKYPHSAL